MCFQQYYLPLFICFAILYKQKKRSKWLRFSQIQFIIPLCYLVETSRPRLSILFNQQKLRYTQFKPLTNKTKNRFLTFWCKDNASILYPILHIVLIYCKFVARNKSGMKCNVIYFINTIQQRFSILIAGGRGTEATVLL